MRWAELPGNEGVKRALAGMVDAGRVPHAILFHEDDGCGGVAMCVAFLQYLMCERRDARSEPGMTSGLFGAAEEAPAGEIDFEESWDFDEEFADASAAVEEAAGDVAETVEETVETVEEVAEDPFADLFVEADAAVEAEPVEEVVEETVVETVEAVPEEAGDDPFADLFAEEDARP